MEQLRKLAVPFPDHFIENVQGKDYVKHAVVNQKLLACLGPFSYSIDEIIYNSEGTVEACLATLTVEIDGKTVTVQEAGDAENKGAKGNNGTLLQTASSSAFKKCAMRVGVGLHLWSGEDYYLPQWLDSIYGSVDKELLTDEELAVEEEAPAVEAKKKPSKKASKTITKAAVAEAKLPEPEAETVSDSEMETLDTTEEVIQELQDKLGAEIVEDVSETPENKWSHLRKLFDVIEDKDQKAQAKKDFKNRYEMQYEHPLPSGGFKGHDGEAEWCIEQAILLIEMHQSIRDEEAKIEEES